MRLHSVALLAAITVPVTLAAVLWPNASASLEETQTAGPMLPGLKAKLAQATHLRISGPDGSVELRRTDTSHGAAEGWGLATKGGYPVPAATLKPVLNGLVALTRVEPKTEHPALYGRIDLAPPGAGSEARGVTVLDAQGATLASIILGRHKYDPSGQGNDGIYARVPDAPRAWLAQKAITIPAGALDWIDRQVIDLDTAKIKQITLTRPGAGPLVFTRAKEGDKFTLAALPAGTKLKSDDPGSDIANGFHGVELADVKPSAQLVGTPNGTAEATLFDGTSVTISLTKQHDQTWLNVAATGKNAGPITARTAGWAYQVAEAAAKPLTTGIGDITDALQKPAPKK